MGKSKRQNQPSQGKQRLQRNRFSFGETVICCERKLIVLRRASRIFVQSIRLGGHGQFSLTTKLLLLLRIKRAFVPSRLCSRGVVWLPCFSGRRFSQTQCVVFVNIAHARRRAYQTNESEIGTTGMLAKEISIGHKTMCTRSRFNLHRA